MEKETKKGFFVKHRTVSAVKIVEFVSDGMSFIVLRGCLCNIIILNVCAPNEEKCNYSQDRFYEEMGQTFNHFPKYHTIFSNQQMRMTVYIRTAIIMVSEYSTVPH
jgi:hypothetical protein